MNTQWIMSLWGTLKSFFDSPKVIVLFVLLLLTLAWGFGGTVFGINEGKKLREARLKIEDADRALQRLRGRAEESVKQYDALAKIVQEKLKANKALVKRIEKEKKTVEANFKVEAKKIKKMDLGKLAKEFKKLGY